MSVLAIAACIVVAGLVAVAAPVQARGWLGFTFPGLAARPAVAVGILAHNLRSLAGVFVLLIFARLAPRAPDKRTARLAVRLGELILAGAITANVVVVAAALGAYRERMVLALMPHGPVELAAYSLAHRALPPRPPPQPARRVRGHGCRRRAWRCWRSPPCSRHG